MGLLHRARIAVLVCTSMAWGAPSWAITGGHSVAESLAVGSDARGASARAATARDVLRYTVHLVMVDAGRTARGACTGVLIHPTVVLTAGHCLYGDGGRRLRARAFFPEAGASRPSWRESVDEAIHPRFASLFDASGVRPRATEEASRYLVRRGGFASVDLALLLLHRAAPEEFVPVPLVAPGFRASSGATRLIAGYGRADGFAPAGVPALRFAEVRMSPAPDHAEGALLIESRYGSRGRVSTCSGDSGGPLLVAAPGGWRLAGIHSAGDRHCREEAWMADIDRERVALRALFRSLTAGTPAQTGNPF